MKSSDLRTVEPESRTHTDRHDLKRENGDKTASTGVAYRGMSAIVVQEEETRGERRRTGKRDTRRRQRSDGSASRGGCGRRRLCSGVMIYDSILIVLISVFTAFLGEGECHASNCLL